MYDAGRLARHWHKEKTVVLESRIRRFVQVGAGNVGGKPEVPLGIKGQIVRAGKAAIIATGQESGGDKFQCERVIISLLDLQYRAIGSGLC